MEILATLHPDNNPNDDLFPNVKKENIPSKAINLEKLSDEVKKKLPKVINSDSLLPATKLKYLEIDGTTYYIPQLTDITSNIKITGNKSDILSSNHKLLCLLSDTSSLAIKVVDKIEGGSEELSTFSEVLPQALYGTICSAYNDNIYIFGGNGSNGRVSTIYKFNCIEKTITTLSATLPTILSDACCARFNDNIYIFGGYSSNWTNTIFKFNCTTETITTLSVKLPKQLYGLACSIYKNNIYIFGGWSGSYSYSIYKFNCSNETITTLSIILPTALYYVCCATYYDNIYLFGGNGNNGGVNTIYKFNCSNETITTLSTTLPQTLYGAFCSISDNNIYIFGGYNSKALDTIYKFDCVTEKITTLSATLPNALCFTSCSTYENHIFIFGGGNNSSKRYDTILDFLVSSELAANNVLIYNANSNYSFDLITDQVTIPIKKVYIGDSNNTAQLANAYLYDETQTAWVNVNTGQVLTL